MVRLGKRKIKEVKTEEDQMKEEVIGSPGKALFGDDPHEAPKIAHNDPGYFVQVCTYKKEAREFKVVLTKDMIYSKLLKNNDKRKEVCVYLQLLTRKDLPNNFFVFKHIGSTSKKDEDLKNYGADYNKAQQAYNSIFDQMRSEGFVEQFVDHTVTRAIDVDQLDHDMSTEADACDDVQVGMLAKDMLSLKGIEQSIRSESVNTGMLLRDSPEDNYEAIYSALNILQRINECLDTRQYSDLPEAAIEGLSIKFYEKIPHTFDLLEVKKYNLNSYEKIKAKIDMIRLLSSYEVVYKDHARYRESIDFDGSANLHHHLSHNIPEFKLSTIHRRTDIEAINNYFKVGLTRDSFDISQVYSIKKSKLKIVDEQDTSNSSFLWLPCRVETLYQSFKDNFEPVWCQQAMDNLQDEACSVSLYDSAGAAIASLKRNIPCASIALVLCQVKTSEQSPVVSKESDLSDITKSILKLNNAADKKKKQKYRPAHVPTILEGRYKIDASHTFRLDDCGIHIPTGKRVLTDTIDADYLFGKTVVYSAGWITPKLIVRIK